MHRLLTRLLTRRPQVVGVLALVTTAGCAQRGLSSGPPSPPGAGTWLAVGVAATAAALVLAALVALPGRRRDGSALAAAVLAAQAGAAAVATAVIAGAALQSGRLVGRAPEAEAASSLVGLSDLDGGSAGFFTLMAIAVAVLGGLAVVVLGLASRCARDADPLNRAIASAVLVVEASAAAVALVLVVVGERTLPFVVPAASLPLLVLAAISGWPRAATR